jgi:hypothetical protein
MTVVTFLPGTLQAQAELQGRVLADSGRKRVANAEVAIPTLDLRALSDSSGRYRLEQIPRGTHIVVTRAVGFRPDTTIAEIDGGETIVRDVTLRPPVAMLDEVHVEGESNAVGNLRLAAYETRKAAGIGYFFDRGVFEQDSKRRVSDVLSAKVPGLTIHRGKGSRAWAATGRGGTPAKCALCRVDKKEILDDYDSSSGAPLACYVDVYLDGMNVYSAGGMKRPLFNLNSVNARDIEAIEVYTSAAQIPTQFIRTGNDCGVMAIWTRARR